MKKSYYAIIPADVRYSPKLTANAKLLYGEITALCNEKGYCWATNAYFSDLYGKDKRTISSWVSQLSAEGFIKVNLIQGEDGKTDERQITLTGKISSTPHEENFHPPTKKSSTLILHKNNNNMGVIDFDGLSSEIPDGCRELAAKYWLKKGAALDVDEQWLLFTAHHQSKPNAKIKNYNAAWRTWYVNAVKFNKKQGDKKGDAFTRMADNSWADGLT